VHGQAFEQDRQGLDFYFEVVMQRLVLIALFAGLLGGARLLAHHSFAAEFDDKQPIKLTGTLKKVEWTNPHIWYYVEVKNPDGTTTLWALSGGAPGQLMRRGIRKEQLVVGAIVNVDGFRAKDGSHNGFGRSVTYQDGRNVFTASAADQQSK
jgi:hypothetical protein